MINSWSKNIIRIAVIVGLILFVPLALQLTIGTGIDGQGFNWELSDFVVMGGLLFCMGLIIDCTRRKFTNSIHKILTIIVVISIFLLIWAELAVGIFGTPFAGS